MPLSLYQIDSFATEVFKGNPAAVIQLEHWLDDRILHKLASENNLAATAFFTASPVKDRYGLRWFTPTDEIPLCAHGTIAAAWVITEATKTSDKNFVFETLAGDLAVERVKPGRYRMNFPIDPYKETPLDEAVSAALGKSPEKLLRARYSVAIYPDEATVRAISPDFSAIRKCSHAKRPGAVVVTAPADAGKEYDFVSRFFAPGVGVDEDPVTGSAHCILAGYWADRLARPATRGYQVSTRGGFIDCEVDGDRVMFTGDAAPYMRGVIMAPL